MSSPVHDDVVAERHRAADVARHAFVVAGQNLDGNAVAFELLEHRRGIRHDGIREADETLIGYFL
jgi:hypothetical protein